MPAKIVVTAYRICADIEKPHWYFASSSKLERVQMSEALRSDLRTHSATIHECRRDRCTTSRFSPSSASVVRVPKTEVQNGGLSRGRQRGGALYPEHSVGQLRHSGGRCVSSRAAELVHISDRPPCRTSNSRNGLMSSKPNRPLKSTVHMYSRSRIRFPPLDCNWPCH